MTREKERLQRVIVLGATPEGIAATNKLGELGVPVTLVDPAPDLHVKLSAEPYRLPSGLTFNFAHRPGLIRILRNSRIRTLLPATVATIKHTPQGFSVRVVKDQTYVDAGRCTLCGKCVEVCPVNGESAKAITFHSRHSLPGRPVIDKRRQPLCQAACPLGVNAQGYVALAAQGRYDQALELIRDKNVLPAICGRICTHPCEDSCRRGELDEAVSIRAIKRFLADYLEKQGRDGGQAIVDRKDGETIAPRTEKVAVIGSGPAGIAAGAELAKKGYRVTVFERREQPGGLLRYGIGAHRLPEAVLERELQAIEQMGVTFACGQDIDLAARIAELQAGHDAVLVTVGSWTDRKLGVPGEDLDGVEGCLSFLTRRRHQDISDLNRKVAVIGDGNSAFDLARTLTRLGAKVTMLSWFSEEEIPADRDEIREALEEGITIRDRTQVTAFHGVDGRLTSLECRATRPGPPDPQGIAWPVVDETVAPWTMDFDSAFVAVGQVGSFGAGSTTPFAVSARGCIAVDERQRTTLPGLYAAGDAVTGPSTVVHAMASGVQAATTIHGDLSGESVTATATRPVDRDFTPISQNTPRQKRREMPERQPAERVGNFQEVALGLSEQQAVAEARRCLQCGVCSECLQCLEACGAVGAIRHQHGAAEVVEQGGVVVIADPTMAPAIRGEDIIRAYGPKAARTDVNDMIVRGIDAAAKAMLLLGGTNQRTKGHATAFSMPDAGLAAEIRIGVFACRCNDSLGWLDGMSAYLQKRQAQDPTIVHVETVAAACISDGVETIIRTAREKGLTRIVLASCVCCPLNFVCSACTDQRSRLKDSLFHGTGISRSMVETCNLRGEILRLVATNPSLAMQRFRGLLHRSIERVKNLRPLPAVDRNYNFAAAVIGNSQATVTSAGHLAAMDHDVFHFDPGDQAATAGLEHTNIHRFAGWTVTGLRGTVGDFQILVQSGDERQVIRAGTVIMGERARRRIPYSYQEGLPDKYIEPVLQQQGVTDIPFTSPCATAVPGLFLAEPSGINVSSLKKGAAAAIMAAAALPRGPRQSKGFTVTIAAGRCRGCGRCAEVCPYHAVTFAGNQAGGWQARVDEAICKGCGNCISVCPTGAADSPFRNTEYLAQALEEILQNDAAQ
ncbi:FAD-dependent oxidoreductase [Desulfoprunum benzoelyticum]|uniref:NADPH-dependent glutamate synthase beta subunit-like oxidoreductase/NAD-dependent dihydropyrimidine dehydrogenase PreA subunit n=1 Tax=Desulfoprunum benzoelyticum TaxID=1506996 RepID=A0A840V682_9BACT|nr:FAD-dependent oxidoreductase [Desulfoprunum benzoelyticum]MBB5349269.1 NADPH-dependent glutamate synthase beta subunit-like oxidoreductase/NAD-dependent dihydropyrimidine dehydrogenase PreA subunit [Desulfoprunum benzoelyticum]MBM9530983.1 FAD-dependent oxidoreductase [Desulfoprunum benzoelyticum]